MRTFFEVLKQNDAVYRTADAYYIDDELLGIVGEETEINMHLKEAVKTDRLVKAKVDVIILQCIADVVAEATDYTALKSAVSRLNEVLNAMA